MNCITLSHSSQFLRCRGKLPLSRCLGSSFNSSSLDQAREKLKNLGEGKVHLTLDNDSGIARICIDQRIKRNAFTGSMMVQLEDAVNTLEDWKTGKAVILEGAGDYFCSGGDISILEMNQSFGSLMTNFMQNILLRLRYLPLFSVSLVHGRAIGGGAEISAATDYRIFSPKGEVHFVHGIMGLIPGWGGITWLNHALGHKKAMNLLLTSKRLSALDALEIGFADVMAPEEKERFSFAQNWILKRASHHPDVLKSIKIGILGAQRNQIEESLKNEQIQFLNVWGGPVNLEAMSKKIKHK